jgi:hypothetical protein
MNSPSKKPVVFAFNGDADGIISQHLLHLAGIAPALRVTGLKRDLRLLQRVPESFTGTEGCDLYVCDINLGDNRDDLLRMLRNPTIRVTWYDHHEPGEVPRSSRFKAHIVTARGTCTALLVHADLARKGAFAATDNPDDPHLGERGAARWAAMAAFGDNVPESADALLAPLSLPAAEREALREAGELLNYNAYGETPEDVLFAPLEVAERMSAFRDPAAFLQDSGLIEPLRRQLQEDEHGMGGLSPVDSRSGASLYALPGEAWARRLGSTFANRVALAEPGRAVAILHPLADGAFQVSIRAPRGPQKNGARDATPASTLAREFPSGGGRALAAGINHLPAEQVEAFTRRFFDTYQYPYGRRMRRPCRGTSKTRRGDPICGAFVCPAVDPCARNRVCFTCSLYAVRCPLLANFRPLWHALPASSGVPASRTPASS